MSDVQFTITCTMDKDEARNFIGMLDWMEHLGNIGSSEWVAIFADGDGKFRPKFNICYKNVDKDYVPHIKKPYESSLPNAYIFD